MRKLIHRLHANLAGRCALRPTSRRGFTLIELMVVVVIITLMAGIALPGVSRRLKSYRAKSTAEEIAAIYRNARLRAMGRGGAVLVRYNDGSFEIREAIQGDDASDASGAGDCRPLPATSCTTPSGRWNSNARSQQVATTLFGLTEYNFALLFRSPANPATEITDRTALDICFTPLGKPYADMTTLGTYEQMTTAPRFDVSRKDAVGLARSVLINTVGPARVVAQ